MVGRAGRYAGPRWRAVNSEQGGGQGTSGGRHGGVVRAGDGEQRHQVLAAADVAPDDVPANLLAADVEVLSGQAERAYARLVELVRRSSGEDRDAVRKHLLALFSVAGPDDPAVAGARRALASALF